VGREKCVVPKLIEMNEPNVGKEYPLEQEEIIIGRGSKCDIVISDEDVSRQHAKIVCKGKAYIIEDLNSTNGTFVNGNKAERAVLNDLDRIRLGKKVFTFSSGEAFKKSRTSPTMVNLRSEEVDSTTILNSIDARDYDITREREGVAAADQLVKIRRRLNVVNEINRAIAGSLDLDTVLNMILTDLFSVYAQAERGFILLVEDGSERLIPKAVKYRDKPAEERMMVSSTVVRSAISRQRAILSADASTDEQFATKQSIADFHVHSVMCVPLIYKEEILGVIYIDTTRPDATFSEDDLSLLTGIALQAAVSIASAQMHERILRQSRLEQDLRFAKRVQLAFLPQESPKVADFEFVSHYTAAREIGGDFYNFIELDDGVIGVIVADVSGKGAPAALMMARLTSDVRFIALHEKTPNKVLVALNDLICREMQDTGFVTAAFLTIDATTNTLTIGNAGHPPPLIKRPSSGELLKFEESIGLPLGVTEEGEYEEERVVLEKGDSVTLYSDGVIEAMDREERFYTQARLEQYIAEAPPEPQKIVDGLLLDLKNFFKDKPQNDDLTLVCFGKTE
jgi:serine phosphatase RsbU (regulator of sigma subunit)